MTDLPSNSLVVFPVGYPKDWNHSYVPHTERGTRWNDRMNRRLDDSPTEIMFCNMFGGERPGGRGHRAIDILAARGLPIYAARGGRIAGSWRVQRRNRQTGTIETVVHPQGTGSDEHGGNFVLIEDDDGYFHYYTHMVSPLTLAAGAAVRAGQLLGHVGHSGSAAIGSYPHLHYQVTQRNAAGAQTETINPYNELVRVAVAQGGAFESDIQLRGYHSSRWMIIRFANYR